MTRKAALTFQEFASLCARGARVHFRRASVEVRRVKVAGTETRRFYMEGPSGSHSLDVDSTDLQRLNAHWVTFATCPRNAFPERT